MRRGVRRVAVAVLAGLWALAAACDTGSGPTQDVIDRETFIATWVDLRRTALSTPDATLTDEARTEVLGRHGVTEEDLLAFADAYGRDVNFLKDLWTEVEARMDSISAGGGDSPS